MIIFVSGVVGFIVISMQLPIFALYSRSIRAKRPGTKLAMRIVGSAIQEAKR